MNGKTISELQFLQNGKQVDHEERKPSQLINNSLSASSPVWLKSECSAVTPSPPAINTVLAFNRSVNTNSSIAFLQEQHAAVLKGLHQHVEELQRRCKDLQFCLTLQIPYVSDEERSYITLLEKKLLEKEQECTGLKEELFKSDYKIQKLRQELQARDHLERQLRKEIEKYKRNDIADGMTLSERGSEVQYREKLPSKDNPRHQRPRSLSSVAEPLQPTPPPKVDRNKISARPAAFYRRLLGLGVPMLKETSPPVGSPPLPQVNVIRDRSATSSVPQLPRITGSPTQSPIRQRPLVRQQLRVSKLRSNESQTLSIDQSPLGDAHHRRSDPNY